MSSDPFDIPPSLPPEFSSPPPRKATLWIIVGGLLFIGLVVGLKSFALYHTATSLPADYGSPIPEASATMDLPSPSPIATPSSMVSPPLIITSPRPSPTPKKRTNVSNAIPSATPSSATTLTSNPHPTGTPTPGATATPTPVPTPTPTPGPGHYYVNILYSSFIPDGIVIHTGDTVTWTNQDGADYTVTSTFGGPLNSGTLSLGQTYSYTFTSPGTYYYYSNFHQFMTAGVIVN